MENNMLRKGLVLAIMVLFVGASVIPSISGNVSKMNDIKDVETRIINDVIQANEEEPHAVSTTDWWPMFHHDLRRSGYSTSAAPDTNNVKWSYTIGAVKHSSPAVVDGKVYVGSYDHKVYCLNAETGAWIWDYTTGNVIYSSPAVADGKVYIGSHDCKVYCLNAETGAWIWDYTTGFSVRSSPAVADGKVYIGSSDHKVYCLNAETGAKIWDHSTEPSIVYSAPAVADGKVYVGAGDMYCLDAETGAEIWYRNIYGAHYSSPAVADGKVYIGSYDRRVYCLDADTGDYVWSYGTGSRGHSSPAVADGKVYIGSYDHKVYCLNANTGTKIWSYTTGDDVQSSPAVADGKVYVGSRDHKVYCLNAETGAKIWDYTTGNVVYSSPAVANGKVYIGSYDSKVYCFEDEPDPFYFVHITDLHIVDYIGADDENWKMILAYIRQMNPRPEFVLCTGDLVDWGCGWVGGWNYGELTAHLWKQSGVFYVDPGLTIPIYFCPGNHDARGLLFGNDFTNYYNNIKGTDYYMVKHKNYAIFSMNSGVDDWQEKPWWDNWGQEASHPEGDGLHNKYSNELNQFISDLDNLDGVVNGRDDSPYVKIVMTHHPYSGARASQLDMVFWYGRDTFLQACIDYEVDLLFCGHIHNFGNVRRNFSGNDQVITNAVAYSNHFRQIFVDSSGSYTIGDMWKFNPTYSGLIGCNTDVHIYDNLGNHNGPNATGEIERQIPLSSYSHWRFQNDTLGINATNVEFRLPIEDTSNYTIIIESLANDSMNVTLFTSLVDGSWIEATYVNTTMYEGSIATLYTNNSTYDYSLYIDDDGDGVIDREIEPTNITTNPPFIPDRPDGPISGKPGVEYTYTTSTTDLNGDQVYYKWNWDDGTYSGWIGPYNSGETAQVKYTWMKQGNYSIRVKAKDVYDCESDWSDPLPVTMPRGKPYINTPFLRFLENYPNMFPILQKIIQRLGLQ